MYAIVGGVVFNVANLLLIAAIEIAGLAVAFPIGIGLALVIGAILNYVIRPEGNPLLLFGGVTLVAVAILLDAAAYRRRETKAKAATARGILISLACGVLMGCFYPFVARALNGVPGRPAPGPYAISFFFILGVLVSTLPANFLLMKQPLDGKPPVDGADYRKAPMGWHLAGILGGAIWCVGGTFNFVASGGAPCRPRRLLLHRAGSDHGLSRLGSLRVARICRRAARGKAALVLHVYLLSARIERRGSGASLCVRPHHRISSRRVTLDSNADASVQGSSGAIRTRR